MYSMNSKNKLLPSKNSAFKPYLPKINRDNQTQPNESKVDKVIKKGNPHGYSWRVYTEAEMRDSLKKDVIYKNFLQSAINRHMLEMSELQKYSGKAAFESYMTIKDSLIKTQEKLKQIEHKMDLHRDYQLYVRNTR